MKHFYLLMMGLFLSTTTHTAEPDTQPYLASRIGTGTLSCGLFIKHKEASDPQQMDLFVQWVWGFMSAYNLRGNFGSKFTRPTSGNLSATSLPDAPTVLLFLEKHCRARPLDDVMDGTISLVREIGGQIVWKSSR